MMSFNKAFEMQQGLQRRLYGSVFATATTEWRTAYIKEHSIHITQEIHEMLYELPHFKPWKDYSQMGPVAEAVAIHKAKEELVDTFHFFMNLMIGLGMTPAELLAMYEEKNLANHKRQDDGYTHDVTYREGEHND